MATTAPARSLLQAPLRWRPHDGGMLSLRRAARAALLMPALFAATLLGTHDVQLTTFVGFGTFAMIVLADFGGPASRRAVAYLVTALVGAVLIVAGTLAGQPTWLAVLSMLVVG